MRNVNLSKCAGYEGIEDRFILTMRNVNLGALKIKKLSEIGFILTMRNVNTNGFFFAAITFIVLY